MVRASASPVRLAAEQLLGRRLGIVGIGERRQRLRIERAFVLRARPFRWDESDCQQQGSEAPSGPAPSCALRRLHGRHHVCGTPMKFPPPPTEPSPIWVGIESRIQCEPGKPQLESRQAKCTPGRPAPRRRRGPERTRPAARRLGMALGRPRAERDVVDAQRRKRCCVSRAGPRNTSNVRVSRDASPNDGGATFQREARSAGAEP